MPGNKIIINLLIKNVFIKDQKQQSQMKEIGFGDGHVLRESIIKKKKKKIENKKS